MASEFDRSGLLAYDEEQEEWDAEGLEAAPPVRRAVSRGRGRLGRTLTLRGVLGLLLLVLLAVAVWWGVQTILLSPAPTPTPTAIATLAIVPYPTSAATPAETVAVVTPVPSPTQPLTATEIDEGQTVRVTGTDQDGIRFRSGPGTTYGTLAILGEGTKLKVLEGSEVAEGRTWWRLEMEDGTIGWAAEDWLQAVAGAD